jgi:hypothetical protein
MRHQKVEGVCYKCGKPAVLAVPVGLNESYRNTYKTYHRSHATNSRVSSLLCAKCAGIYRGIVNH